MTAYEGITLALENLHDTYKDQMIAEAEKLFTPKYDQRPPDSKLLQNVFENNQNGKDEDDYINNKADSFQDDVGDLDEEDANAI
eukprot:14099493-Ditylum_brightwellii.AAC.1